MELISLIRQKFLMDVVWTLTGSAITALSGIGINILVARFYGAEGLGYFAVAMAVYLVLSLFAAFGVQSSVMKYTAEFESTHSIPPSLLPSALVVVLFASTPVFLIAHFVLPLLFPHVFPHLEFVPIYLALTPALFFSALNKSCLAFLNGRRAMRPYSVFQSLRFLLVALGFLIGGWCGRSLTETSLCVVFSEALVFLSLVVFIRPSAGTLQNGWLRRHALFGFHCFLSDVFAETGSKLDTLLVSMLSNPVSTGIYAFASDLAKGLLGLAIVIQINFNPIISRLWSQGERSSLVEQMRRIRRNTYLAYVPVFIVSLIAYPILIKYAVKGGSMSLSTQVFYILLSSTCVFSGYSALLGVLPSSGFAKTHAKMIVATLCFNIAATFALMPALGILGAAIGNALSALFMIASLIYLSRRHLGLDLWRLEPIAAKGNTDVLT